MRTLPPSLRRQLERTVVDAREVAESGARAALETLAVQHHEAYPEMSPEQSARRRRLRAHARQLGDQHDARSRRQAIDHLVHECAYEHWHGMLFARFLAENDLLIEPSLGVAVTLEECEELAKDEGIDRWALAARFAQRMLPQVFRPDQPVFEVRFAREHRLKLEGLVESLPVEVFTATDSLGWVYQFWQSRKKAEVNRSEVKIGADELPAVTQLFTEPYMVSFLLDNSLGAWWASRGLTGSDLKAADSEAELRRMAALPGVPLDYLRFVRCGEPAEESTWRPGSGVFEGWPQHLGELKVLDPCCGSGHFLVAAFAMLVPMRMALEGLSAPAAVDGVLRDNLHGLELDPRCVELAAFALALAAWRWPDAGGYRLLPELNLACSGLAPNAAREEWSALAEQAAAAGGMAPERNLFGVDDTLLSAQLRGSMDALHDLFRQAPVLGSLIDPRALRAELLQSDYESVRALFAAVVAQDRADVEQTERAVAAQGMARAADLLAGRYHLVITNVPYLARGKQDQRLRDFCERHYGAAKNDLATVFLERCLSLCVEGGTASLVLPQNWLFLSSYKKLRAKLLKSDTWQLLARLGEGGFESTAAAGAFTVLLTIGRGAPADPPKTTDEWAARLVEQTMAQSKGSTGRSDARGLLNLELGIHEVFADARDQVMERLRKEAARGPSPQRDHASVPGVMYGLDVSARDTAVEKANELRIAGVVAVSQRRQLQNPDHIVQLEATDKARRVGRYAIVRGGTTSGDAPYFRRCFWEINLTGKRWSLQQGTVDACVHFAGRVYALRWEKGRGELADRTRGGGATIAGRDVWGKTGVAISYVRDITVTLYRGHVFENVICVLIPKQDQWLPALWSFCSDSRFSAAIRSVNQKLSVDVRYFEKAHFDLDHWTAVAAERYPDGLPRPYSDDPTQWLFHGHPSGSVVWDDTRKRVAHGPSRTDPTVLQVAVARLLGYRWPAECRGDMEIADEQREWARRCADLQSFADEDGIVCLPSVRGEPSAAERLLRLLAAAFGEAWSDATLARLLASAGSPDLHRWLRDRFFDQHCKLFHHRPFVWHIWDGRRDGFHALVNYHKLAAGEGRGRQVLESLTYSYLGDWIARQRDGVARGAAGSEDRLTAALELQRKIKAVLEGEPPYDIFVRWKPLAEQPIGWEPDIDDGVRVNIRPFMAADIAAGRKGAGILRAKPNVHWRKDRGKELLTRRQKSNAPWVQDDSWDRDEDRELRPMNEYPWFWRAVEFTGDRVNDVHLDVALKLAHRRQAAVVEDSFAATSGQYSIP